MGAHDILLRSPVNGRGLHERLASRGFAPDIVVYMDDGNLPFVDGIEEAGVPLLFYSVDTFCNPWHVSFAHAFDVVCVAQKDYIPIFADSGHAPLWLPLFCRVATEPVTVDEWLEARDIPVSFVGTLKPRNIPDRLPFLKAFARQCPLFCRQGDFVPVFRRSRIVLNQTAALEINFRCFESMGCGAALLTDGAGHGLRELFTPGRDILPPYRRGDVASAVAGAERWLSRPRELAEIALAGLGKVTAAHTDVARAREIVALCRGIRPDALERRRETLPVRRKHIRAAYGAIVAELPPECEQHRAFYLHLAAKYGEVIRR
jgi:hypothetical protein